ncbi:hypothetical protein FRC00_007895, partial [Tulasnella sp. 408]
VIEIVEGLAYLHQSGIIHGDLKGNNALVSSGEHVLLCDFGLAKHVTSRTSTSLRGMGSIPWQSPELLQDSGRRTFQSDTYAFGILVYEVLSGKEPYAHHTGIVSIITGVLSGERPPKEPKLALDGSSYLQFWDEASKCWAENPSSRPRVIDVLKRLDRRRAEALVTSQQRVLEASLAPPTEGTRTQDTLDWAHRIRVRMNVLVNSQRPAGRISREVIIMIINNHLGPSTRKQWGLDYYDDPDTSNNNIKRCTALRTVCRAWRDAIDTTPEFTRYILVHGQKTNIEYIRRCNRDGPVEFFLQIEESPAWSELSSLLGSLVLRVDSLNISNGRNFLLDRSIRSTPFSMLRTVKICRLSVDDPGTFALDLLEMVHAHQDLTELILHSISHYVKPEVPRSRIDHPGLQRVQLTQVSAPIQSHILQCLSLKNSAVLKVDGILLEDLNGSDSAFGDLIRSLGETRILAPSVEITGSADFMKPFRNSDFKVAFCYAVNNGAVLHDGRSSISEATSERSQLRTTHLTAPNAVGMIRMLEGCGIKYLALEEWPDSMLADLLHCFGPLATLQVRLRSEAIVYLLHQLGQSLQQDPESADKYSQFLCPNLTTLDLGSARITSNHSSLIHFMLCLMIQKRQTGTYPTDGPAKLQKIVLPSKLHTENDFRGPLFDGIEICSK